MPGLLSYNPGMSWYIPVFMLMSLVAGGIILFMVFVLIKSDKDNEDQD